MILLYKILVNLEKLAVVYFDCRYEIYLWFIEFFVKNKNIYGGFFLCEWHRCLKTLSRIKFLEDICMLVDLILKNVPIALFYDSFFEIECQLYICQVL